ncbi:UNVERIFIED_CONTAM: hypothetical protein HDU68_008301 [Siphonaria sp. JEL0065]|nr:hypothetical protein HDU68_008301 [Siphonaria sp. JEL0065]
MLQRETLDAEFVEGLSVPGAMDQGILLIQKVASSSCVSSAVSSNTGTQRNRATPSPALIEQQLQVQQSKLQQSRTTSARSNKSLSKPNEPKLNEPRPSVSNNESNLQDSVLAPQKLTDVDVIIKSWNGETQIESTTTDLNSASSKTSENTPIKEIAATTVSVSLIQGSLVDSQHATLQPQQKQRLSALEKSATKPLLKARTSSFKQTRFSIPGDPTVVENTHDGLNTDSKEANSIQKDALSLDHEIAQDTNDSPTENKVSKETEDTNHIIESETTIKSSPLPLRSAMSAKKLSHFPELAPVGGLEDQSDDLGAAPAADRKSSVTFDPVNSRAIPEQPPTSLAPSHRPSMATNGPPPPRSIPPLALESAGTLQEIRRGWKQVLPKISAIIPHEGDSADGIKLGKSEWLERPTSPIEQKGAIPTVVKAIMKRSKMDQQMWKYAGMSDEKRFIYLQNKLRVEEFLEKSKRIKENEKLAEEGKKRAAVELKKPVSVIELFKPKPLPQRIDTTPAVEKYLSTIPADEPEKPLYALRTQFVKDFAILEDRAVKEYQNFWDMRVRDMDVIPHYSLKPYSMEETTGMAWQSYVFLRALPSPIVDYDLGKRLLIVIETDWSTQDKLFEIQKMVAKLPKEAFLILKSTLTHLCRISVIQKSDHHLFRPISNIFAPIMLRIPSRKNSVQREEEYLAKHPSQSMYNRDSIVTTDFKNQNDQEEIQSYDSLSNWKDTESSIAEQRPSSNAAEDILETQAIEAATQAIEAETLDNMASIAAALMAAKDNEPTPSITTRGDGSLIIESSTLARYRDHHHRDHRSSIVSRSTKHTHGNRPRHYTKTVISTMHTGIASSAPEIENLWDDMGGSPPSLSIVNQSIGGRMSVGFRMAPSTGPGSEYNSNRASRITLPSSQNIAIPAASPFSRASVANRKVEEEEEQFNEWVQKQMAEASKMYREKKYGTGVSTSSPLKAENVVTASTMSIAEEWIERLQVPDGELSNSANNLLLGDNRLDSEVPKYFTEMVCAGIKIIVTPPEGDIVSEYYLSNTLKDDNITATEVEALMDALTAQPESAPEVTEIPQEPEVDPEEIIETPSVKEEENQPKEIEHTKFGNLDFGPGDVDGFGWNWMTKKKLATQLLLSEECQSANAALLELMLKNLDVIFDWNMYIASERARADLHAMNV